MAALLLLLMVSLLMLPVQYVVLKPGPTPDTLGEAGDPPRPLIKVAKERTTYPTEGTLRLTTVGVEGVPGGLPHGWEILIGWLNPRAAALPARAVYPPGQTAEEAETANETSMLSSRELAVDVAMAHLGIAPVATVVHNVVPGSPADGKVRAGDVFLAVNGTPAGLPDAVRTRVGSVAPGEEVELRLRRTADDGTTSEVTERVRLAPRQDDASKGSLGVEIKPTYPFDVDIAIDDIGGPSAGLMFTLGIIDKLTPGPLNGGRPVAGTGEIQPDGTVGAIGGIRQKLAGARAAGAEYFLVPRDNCNEALLDVPEGLTLISVANLDEALAALESVREGRPLPTCRATGS